MNLIFQSKDINGRLDFFLNQEPTIYCLQETHFRVKDTQTEGEGMEKDFSYKQKLQESRGSKTHIRQKRVKTKAVNKDKEGHYIMIKGPIQEKNITFVNMYVPEMATHSSILAWKIPRTDEPSGLQFMGMQRVGHNLETKQQQKYRYI